MARPVEAIKGKPGIAGLGERLRCAREMRQLTQGELAHKAGLKESAISHFESGKVYPGGPNLRALSLALNTSADYLLDCCE